MRIDINSRVLSKFGNPSQGRPIRWHLGVVKSTSRIEWDCGVTWAYWNGTDMRGLVRVIDANGAVFAATLICNEQQCIPGEKHASAGRS